MPVPHNRSSQTQTEDQLIGTIESAIAHIKQDATTRIIRTLGGNPAYADTLPELETELDVQDGTDMTKYVYDEKTANKLQKAYKLAVQYHTESLRTERTGKYTEVSDCNDKFDKVFSFWNTYQQFVASNRSTAERLRKRCVEYIDSDYAIHSHYDEFKLIIGSMPSTHADLVAQNEIYRANRIKPEVDSIICAVNNTK